MAIDAQLSAKISRDLQRDFGLTGMQAAAIVGNLAHESGNFKTMQEISPTVPGSRGGYGWAQWTGARRTSFESYAAQKGLDIDSYEANYGYLAHELATTERQAIRAVKEAETLPEATRAFEKSFERAGVKHYDSREKYAKEALDATGFYSQLGAYHQNPIDGLTTSPYDFGAIPTPTKNPGKPVAGITGEDAALPASVFSAQVAAPAIMPAQETIAQNWGSYRTPSMQESVARDSIAKGVDSIFSGLPSYDTAQQAKQDYSGTYGTLGRGLQDNTNVPSLPSDYASHRQAFGAQTPSQVQSVASTNEGLLSSQPSFISSSLAQNMVTPQTSKMADMAAQYGMYTNPDAKAYYSAVDGSIPGVIGPNPTTQQDKALLDPGVPVDDGPPSKKAVKQDRTPLAPEQRGILGGLLGKSPIGGLLGTNPVSNLASGLFSGLNSGFFSGGKSSVSADTLAGIIGNAISATGRGDLTSGRGIRTSSSGLGTSVTSGASKNFDGYDAATNNYGVTTVSNDNMSFIDNSEGASAEGKAALCTHYHKIGWLDSSIYAADCMWALSAPEALINWYHSWAKPLVKQLEKHKWLELALWPPVKLWAFSMFLRYRNLSVNV